MILTYKTRLEPNNKQAGKLKQFAGAARYAYNWALAQEKGAYELGNGFIGDNELRKLFTKHKADNVWLYTISNKVTAQAIKDACLAYKRFFKKQANPPKFKSRKRSKPSFYQSVDKIKFASSFVKLEKITESQRPNKQKLNWIKLSEKNRIPQAKSYLNPRITFNGLHWYVSVGIKIANKPAKPTNQGIGIDLGIKELAVCSDKVTYSNINKTDKVKRLEKDKLRKQRQISRKYEKNKDGNKYVKTKNIAKTELKLLRINTKLTNIRNDYIHKVTTDIVKREPSFIVIEDLNVKGMMRNKHLAKAVQQQNFYRFRELLTYKAENVGIKLIVADRFYPSSKTCSCCGVVKQTLKLTERVFVCNECGLEIDRDYNASLNLYRLGCSTTMPVGINACGVLDQTKVAKAKSGTVKQEINRSLKAS